jgi:regulator of replication initiation timing
VDDLLSNLDPATATIDELFVVIRKLVSRIAELEVEVEYLREENRQLREENKLLREELDRRGGPPTWVKANSLLQQKKAKDKEKQERERKKRSQSFTRKREEATETIFHAAECCPDCGLTLSNGWEHSRRQVIEIPRTSVRIIDHVIMGRYCGVCRKRCLPKVDLSDQVLGKHRLGIGLMSLIGHLRFVCRQPIRTIASLLHALYGVRVSTGEVVEVLHTMAAQGQVPLDHLLEQVRASSCVNGDETGWRENGRNGYLWSFSTPKIRYLHYDYSRAGSIPLEVLGPDFKAALVTDFYAAYNGIDCDHQRCWPHLLRDLRHLKEAHPKNKDVLQWVAAVVAIYDEAIAYKHACQRARTSSPIPFGYNQLQRRDKRREFESRLSWLAAPYIEQKEPDASQRQLGCASSTRHPCTVLAKRIDRFAQELFLFVEHPEVPADNNAAERAIRPNVIMRKITGGTRSPKGSKTQTTLMSLFSTWQLQGLDTLKTCQQMLTQTLPLKQPV